MSGRLELRVPGLRDMEYRRRLLSQPETMAYNRGQPEAVEGYDAGTGCIAFPPEDWRFWRSFWLWQEPDRFSALLLDRERGCFVGEVCYFYDAEEQAHGAGVLIEHAHRGRGFGAEGLRLLAERAFRHDEVRCLRTVLPEERQAAVRCFLRAGFRERRLGEGLREMCLERERA